MSAGAWLVLGVAYALIWVLVLWFMARSPGYCDRCDRFYDGHCCEICSGDIDTAAGSAGPAIERDIEQRRG